MPATVELSPYFVILTAPSSAPLNLSLHEIGSSYALLRWVPPPEPDRNGVIEYYQIYLNSSQGSNISLNTAGSQTHILLNSLYPNTQYVCSVAAVTVSPGPPSTAVLFTTNISGTKSNLLQVYSLILICDMHSSRDSGVSHSNTAIPSIS